MTVDTQEQRTQEALLGTYEVMISLGRLATEFSERESDFRAMIEKLTVIGPFMAPEGQDIQVIPWGRSREIPLDVLGLSSDGSEWRWLGRGEERYNAVVERRNLYDPVFLGKTLEYDRTKKCFWVYDETRQARVVVATDNRVSLVESEDYLLPESPDPRPSTSIEEGSMDVGYNQRGMTPQYDLKRGDVFESNSFYDE